MITCDECGKQLKNTQGLNGHYRFAHRLKSPRSTERVPLRHAELATVGQLEELRAETLEQLELAGEELRAGTGSLVSAAAELRRQLGAAPSAEQRQDLAHGPGLCDSGQCAPCRDYRKVQGPVVWKQAQKAAGDEIAAACEWAGVTSAWNVTVEAVLAYRAKKQGGADPAPLDALASLAQGALDPEPDALTTLMASDPEPRPGWPKPL